MSQFLHEVNVTIMAPSMEYRDADDPRRVVYYSEYGVGGLESFEMMKVVVEYGGEEGSLITAYPDNAVKDGEVLLWPL